MSFSKVRKEATKISLTPFLFRVCVCPLFHAFMGTLLFYIGWMTCAMLCTKGMPMMTSLLKTRKRLDGNTFMVMSSGTRRTSLCLLLPLALALSCSLCKCPFWSLFYLIRSFMKVWKLHVVLSLHICPWGSIEAKELLKDLSFVMSNVENRLVNHSFCLIL